MKNTIDETALQAYVIWLHSLNYKFTNEAIKEFSPGTLKRIFVSNCERLKPADVVKLDSSVPGSKIFWETLTNLCKDYTDA